jgi:hypothetical protein
MGLVIVGVVMMAAAGGLLWLAKQKIAVAGEMAATETSTCASVRQICEEVAKEVGAGSFRQRVEVKGTLKSAAPVTAELSKTPVAKFSTTVQRKYEETRDVKDADGKTRRETHTHAETVSELSGTAPCYVEDATGRLDIVLEDANPEMQKVVDKFDPHQETMGGDLARLLANAVLDKGGGRRTLGYHSSEQVLPLGREVYVLGEASDAGGALKVGKGSGTLVVSLKSEEELVGSAKSAALMARVGAGACLVVGLVLVVMGLVR